MAMTKEEKRVAKAKAELAATDAFLASPVGKLMQANPEMTTREAMEQLGYWKKADAS